MSDRAGLIAAFAAGIAVGIVSAGVTMPADPPGPLTPPVEFRVYPAMPAYGGWCAHPVPDGFDVAVEDAAFEYGVDPWMLAVTVHRESGCDPNARGLAGEIGLAQINPPVWMPTLRDAGIAIQTKDLYDMRTNLRAAAFILREGRRAAAGSAYGAFRRYNGSGPKARQYAREQVAAYSRVINAR